MMIMKPSERIIELVAKEWGVTVKELRSSERTPRLVIPRNAAMWIMRNHLSMSHDAVGFAMGGRDYQSARYGIERHKDEAETNKKVREKTERVMEALTHE
jgi:chromosomal replication initiation ATPase DnaA